MMLSFFRILAVSAVALGGSASVYAMDHQGSSHVRPSSTGAAAARGSEEALDEDCQQQNASNGGAAVRTKTDKAAAQRREWRDEQFGRGSRGRL